MRRFAAKIDIADVARFVASLFARPEPALVRIPVLVDRYERPHHQAQSRF